MEQTVKVRAVYPNGTAQVVHLRQSACSGDCHKCSGCGAQQQAMVFDAVNAIGAKPGDTVTVRTESGPVLLGAAVLYMMPLVLFFLGYALGAALGISGALMACLGFVLGIVLVVVYDRRFSKKVNTVYTITGYAGEALLKSRKKGDNQLG